jgi:hypothetical protein
VVNVCAGNTSLKETEMGFSIKQGVVDQNFIFSVYSDQILGNSFSLQTSINYSSSSLQFSRIQFSSIASSSVSASAINYSGTLSVNATAAAPSSITEPIFSLIFSGNGSGVFDLDFRSIFVNGAAPSIANPPAVSYQILPDPVPSITISSGTANLLVGEIATVAFTLSEPSTDFTVADITARGGNLSNFQGAGTSYSVTYQAGLDAPNGASVSVGSGKFSDALGQFNEDGAEANNKVSFSVAPPAYTLIASSALVNEGASASFSLQTTNIASGFAVPYTISGVSASDLSGGAISGAVTIDAMGKGTITLPTAEDKTTEGEETLTLTIQGQSASVLIKDTSPTPAIPELRITISQGKFQLTEINVASQTPDSAATQVVKYDGAWSASFRADAQALLSWHQDRNSIGRNSSLDGLSLDVALGALDRGLTGAERAAFIELVGLIADCKIVNGVPFFDGNFG